MLLLLEKTLVYGCLGLIIENLFTGIGALVHRDWTAKTRSYLWMLPIYGFTALALEAVSQALIWPFYLKAFVYVPIIYGVEALSGWTIQRLIGTIPWDYHKSAWTPMGLINLKYAPFWLLLAMAFDPITDFLTKLLHQLSLVA